MPEILNGELFLSDVSEPPALSPAILTHVTVPAGSDNVPSKILTSSVPSPVVTIILPLTTVAL